MSKKLPYNYEMEDSFFLLHEDDPDLPTIKIPLPKFTGDITQVYNYGLAPEDQFYPYEVVPDTIKNFETIYRERQKIKKDKYVQPSELLQFLKDNQVEFQEELQWVKRVQHHRFHGQWVFIHGKLTFIHRWNYTFVNFWFVDNDNPLRLGFPDYRDRDRRFFLAQDYFYTDKKQYYTIRVHYTNEKGDQKTDYFNLESDKNKFLEKLSQRNLRYFEETGFFVFDTPNRTSLGTLYYKHRREGATYKAQCISYCIQSEGLYRNTAFQSKSDKHTDEVMLTKVHEPLKKLVWCLLLDFRSVPKTILPKEQIEWKSESKTRDSKQHGGFTLNAGAGDYGVDGMKLAFLHCDEIAKKDPETRMNMLKRWNVSKKCLSTGNGRIINGFSIHTSTVGDKTRDGGLMAEKLAKQSMLYDSNGQTLSGLTPVFFSAADGLEGFVDPYGKSIIEDPDKPILGIDGKYIEIGAKTFLLNKRSALEASGDYDALNEDIRQFPIYFKECFRESNQQSTFNVELINRVNERLKNIKPAPTETYNIEFSQGYGTPANLIPDGLGKWKISRVPELHERNQFVYGPDGIEPAPNVWGKKIIGMDPVKYHKHEVEHGKFSDSAGAIWYPYDEEKDNGKHRQDWDSQRFLATYKYRTDNKFMYAEEMAAASVLFGALGYPENNFNLISDEWQRNDMRGYLIFDLNEQNNPKPKPGASTTNSGIVDDLFSLGSYYVNNDMIYDSHAEINTEFMLTNGPEDMTNRDLFVATTFALLGAQSKFIRFAKEEKKKQHSLSQFFPNMRII